MSAMKSDFRFRYDLRVRFSETDLQGIVFNSHYLTYFDVAWLEYFRSAGMSREELVRLGNETVLARTTLEFKSPARFDEALTVYARVSHIGNTSTVFEYEIYTQDDARLIASASSVYVQINPETLAAMRVPDSLRETIARVEGRAIS